LTKKWTSKRIRRVGFGLYLKGVPLLTIAQACDVSLYTVERWRTVDQWVKKKGVVCNDSKTKQAIFDEVERFLKAIDYQVRGNRDAGADGVPDQDGVPVDPDGGNPGNQAKGDDVEEKEGSAETRAVTGGKRSQSRPVTTSDVLKIREKLEKKRTSQT
jgi:uncharacterized protein YjcR